MKSIEYIEIILKGIITGILIAYLLILGLRPSVMYPDNILDVIDNPWVFLVLLILNYYVFLWDDTVGFLLLLTLIALLLDIILFTEGGFFKNNLEMEVFTNITTSYNDIARVNYIEKKPENTVTDKKNFKDMNDLILNRLKEYQSKLKTTLQASNEPPAFI
jgi:hypothetical protein